MTRADPVEELLVPGACACRQDRRPARRCPLARRASRAPPVAPAHTRTRETETDMTLESETGAGVHPVVEEVRPGPRLVCRSSAHTLEGGGDGAI